MLMPLGEVDVAQERLRSLKDSFDMQNDNINEATTRLKIIDEIFISVLGWPKKLLEVEYEIGESTDDKKHKIIFADYIAEADQNYFIIEAKRTGSYFTLPNTRARTYKSTGVIYNSENKDYIDQAKKYMKKIGTPYCVLTNGYQFIIIRAYVHDRDKDTIVFKSIEDIEKNFVLFWNILSPTAHGSEEIDKFLNAPNEVRKQPIFNKRIIDIIKNTDKNYALVKQSAIVAIESHLNRFFGELTSKSQIDLLKECYCDPSGNYKDFAGVIRKRLEPKPIQAITPLYNKDLVTQGNFEKQYIENLQSDPGAVYVLLGEVGVGKSTFLEHFYNFELSDIEKNKIVWIRIDFLNFNESLQNLNSFISNVVIERIESTEYEHFQLSDWETLQKIYSKEISNHLSGIPPMLKTDEKYLQKEIWEHIKQLNSDKEYKLKKVIEYIQNYKKLNVCFVFDNIDQKSFTEQREVLLIAHQRAASYSSTVITAMRYQSYNMIKKKSPYDALQPYEYRVLPPSAKELLEKRFEALLSYPQKHYIYQTGKKTVKVPVLKFVQILRNTLEKDPEAHVERLFESLSGGNIRKLLKMFRAMITSGNTRLHEILDIVDAIANLDNTKLSYYQVLDGVIRDNNQYYLSEVSSIFNLFKFQSDGFYSHFLSIYILKYLESKFLYKDDEKGYVDIDDLMEEFSLVVIERSNLDEVLTPLLANFLINSDVGAREDVSNTNAVQISDAGLYYLNNFLDDWHYIFHMIVDTPIRDDKCFRELRSHFEKIKYTHNKIAREKQTYQCVEIFLNYLTDQENNDYTFYPEGFPIKPVMGHIKNSVHASFINFQKNRE